jgi:hypothetical protein
LVFCVNNRHGTANKDYKGTANNDNKGTANNDNKGTARFSGAIVFSAASWSALEVFRSSSRHPSSTNLDL